MLRCAVALLAMAATGTVGARAASQYHVKAEYLLNFARFVTWPVPRAQTEKAPFVICVLGRDPFGKTLDEVVRGAHLRERPFVVRRYTGLAHIAGCNILFIGDLPSRELRAALSAIQGHSVLTVSDADGPERDDIMIRFVTESEYVRLIVNLAAVKAAKLTMSSQLLRLVQIVGNRPIA